MKIVETEAIILNSYSLAEADKIILLFTKQSGLVRLSVRGAKRLKNRFGGRLEPFTVADIVYAQKEDAELGRLVGAETLESHFHLATRLNVLNALSYLSKLLMVMTPVHEPNEVLYRMVKACLEAIASVKDDLAAARLVVSYFEIWLLRLTGFLPDFRTCSKCRSRIGSKTVYYWAVDAQLICQDCTTSNRRGEILAPQIQKLIRAALVQPPLKFVEMADHLNVKRDDLDTITHRLLRKIIEFEPDYWSNDLELEEAAQSRPKVA
jgi:DNA repair protein RecO (recombination protein O)